MWKILISGDLPIYLPYKNLLKYEYHLLQKLEQSIRQSSALIANTIINDRTIKLMLSFFISILLALENFNKVIFTSLRKSNIIKLQQQFQLLLQKFKKQKLLTSQIKLLKQIPENINQFNNKCIIILPTQQFLLQINNLASTSLKKNFDFIFLEANIIDQHFQEILSCDFNQIVIRRAHKQLKKIEKYFLHAQDANWNSEEAKKKLEKSMQTGREIMQNKKKIADYQQLPTQSVLINLCLLRYLLSYLQSKQLLIERKKQTPTTKTSKQFLDQLINKLLVPNSLLSNLKGLMKKIMDIKQFKSICYLPIICDFFYNLVTFHQAFQAKYPKNAFRIIVQPRMGDSQLFEIRMKCINPKIIFDQMTSVSQSLAVLQNFCPPYQYLKHTLQLHSSNPIHVINFDQIDQMRQQSLLGLIITTTPSQDDLTTKYKYEDNEQQANAQRAYGVFLHDICQVTPDGVIVYMPSHAYIQIFKTQWQKKEKIYESINKSKRIFQESQFEEINRLNIIKFKAQCDIGRGAVFLISCRGKMAKYEQFFGHYSKCIVFMGFPANLDQIQMKEKLSYFEEGQRFSRNDDAMKHVAKCLSNCINSVLQSKIILFVDVGFNDTSTKKWFPFVKKEQCMTLEAIGLCRSFERKILHQEDQWDNNHVDI